MDGARPDRLSGAAERWMSAHDEGRRGGKIDDGETGEVAGIGADVLLRSSAGRVGVIGLHDDRVAAIGAAFVLRVGENAIGGHDSVLLGFGDGIEVGEVGANCLLLASHECGLQGAGEIGPAGLERGVGVQGFDGDALRFHDGLGDAAMILAHQGVGQFMRGERTVVDRQHRDAGAERRAQLLVLGRSRV